MPYLLRHQREFIFKVAGAILHMIRLDYFSEILACTKVKLMMMMMTMMTGYMEEMMMNIMAEAVVEVVCLRPLKLLFGLTFINMR